jgi:succinylglutamate desuccinylase
MTEKSVSSLLDAFLSVSEQGPFAFSGCDHFAGRGGHSRHAVLGFIIHGNEHGSLPAALELQRELRRAPPAGPVTLLLGNVEAARADRRFLDEDFNRVFTFDRPATSRERRRAEQVRPLLDAADVFLDFHQTQTPTRSGFYTFPWEQELGLWARALGAAPRGLTRRAGAAFSPGTRCLDEYVRDRGKVGLTVELGFRGQDEAQAAAALAASRRLLALLDEQAEGQASLHKQAERQPPIDWYTTVAVLESRGAERRLRPGLENWTPVRAGELLSAPDSEPLVSPVDGALLFPKYAPPGEALPPELVRVAAPIAEPNELG